MSPSCRSTWKFGICEPNLAAVAMHYKLHVQVDPDRPLWPYRPSQLGQARATSQQANQVPLQPFALQKKSAVIFCLLHFFRTLPGEFNPEQCYKHYDSLHFISRDLGAHMCQELVCGVVLVRTCLIGQPLSYH
jgi:hypothetical protein